MLQIVENVQHMLSVMFMTSAVCRVAGIGSHETQWACTYSTYIHLSFNMWNLSVPSGGAGGTFPLTGKTFESDTFFGTIENLFLLKSSITLSIGYCSN